MGDGQAKFSDILWIVVLGTVISLVFGHFFQEIVASFILLVILLGLVKYFFCGWLKALAINITAAIIYIVIGAVLVLIGISVGLIPIENGIMYF